MAVMENFKIRIHNYPGELITLDMFRLLQWIAALRAEIKHGAKLSQARGRKTSTVIGKFLKCPPRYPAEHMLEHLETCKTNIEKQLKEVTPHD